MENRALAWGYTLLEALVTLAIAGLLTALAVPGYRELTARNRGSAAVNELFGALQLARESATFYRTTTTMCPSAGAGCGTDWGAGYLIFVDRNGNGVPDPNDRVLARGTALHGGASLSWRSFRRRPFLQYTSRGLTHAENGSFVYCSGAGAADPALKIVINTAGRARLVRDDSLDGRFDDGSGPSGCPRP